jgi:hypothetical protein
MADEFVGQAALVRVLTEAKRAHQRKNNSKDHRIKEKSEDKDE